MTNTKIGAGNRQVATLDTSVDEALRSNDIEALSSLEAQLRAEALSIIKDRAENGYSPLEQELERLRGARKNTSPTVTPQDKYSYLAGLTTDYDPELSAQLEWEALVDMQRKIHHMQSRDPSVQVRYQSFETLIKTAPQYDIFTAMMRLGFFGVHPLKNVNGWELRMFYAPSQKTEPRITYSFKGACNEASRDLGISGQDSDRRVAFSMTEAYKQHVFLSLCEIYKPVIAQKLIAAYNREVDGAYLANPEMRTALYNVAHVSGDAEQYTLGDQMTSSEWRDRDFIQPGEKLPEGNGYRVFEDKPADGWYRPSNPLKIVAVADSSLNADLFNKAKNDYLDCCKRADLIRNIYRFKSVPVADLLENITARYIDVVERVEDIEQSEEVRMQNERVLATKRALKGRVAAFTAHRDETAQVGAERLTQVPWEILPPGELREAAVKMLEESNKKVSKGEESTIDFGRLKVLEHLRQTWGVDNCYYVVSTAEPNEDRKGYNSDYEGAYIILVLQKIGPDGKVIDEDAVAVSPITRHHAAYACRGDVSEKGWRVVFSQTKEEAQADGARAIKHVAVEGETLVEAMDRKLLDVITADPYVFRYGEFNGDKGLVVRKMAKPAIEATVAA